MTANLEWGVAHELVSGETKEERALRELNARVLGQGVGGR